MTHGDAFRVFPNHGARFENEARLLRGGMTNAQIRRSRIKRAPRGKLLKITQRDLAIFGLLAQYRYLSSDFIHAFVGGTSVKRFKERLCDLFHEGYLDRPQQQWFLQDARCAPAVHERGRGAERALAPSTCGDNGARTYLGESVARQFVHALLICEVLASIELEARATRGLRFIAWKEILGRAPEATRRAARPYAIPVPCSRDVIIPDAVFGLEYSGSGRNSYRFFALEIDRATMPLTRESGSAQTSFAGKLEGYGSVIKGRSYRDHLGIPNLLVLTLTMGEGHLQNMIANARHENEGRAALLFKTLAGPCSARGLRRPIATFLAEPWQRPLREPLVIGRA